MRNVVLTGFKSSGKSTVGQVVARRLGADFVDLDTVIEDLYEAAKGERLGFRDIFRREGAEAFRDLELDAAREVARRVERGEGPLVLALGGGALGREETREAVKRIGPIVFLRVPFETILPRVERGGFPAYVKGPDHRGELESIFREREPIYAAHADLVVDAGDLLPAASGERVIEALEGME